MVVYWIVILNVVTSIMVASAAEDAQLQLMDDPYVYT